MNSWICLKFLLADFLASFFGGVHEQILGVSESDSLTSLNASTGYLI